jgi:hypothetical protein
VLAIFELANCFRHGWGIPKDPVAAKQVRLLILLRRAETIACLARLSPATMSRNQSLTFSLAVL